MLNLFKSSKQIVAEIHNEIDTAEDRLLIEARRVIDGVVDNAKAVADRLEAVGFTQSKAVVAHKIKKQRLVEGEAAANLIEYYKQTYPFQKFITESEMDRICKKYGLVYAPVSAYKNDVPEKNLIDIEYAPLLKAGDSVFNRIWCTIDYSGSLAIGESKARWLGLPFKINGMHFSGWITADQYLKQIYPKLANRSYTVGGVKNFTQDIQGLFIAAPKSHFDLTGLKEHKKYGFLNISITEVKDPIVFRYVRGGIQIITKWGLEASDEIVVNEKMN